MTQLSMVTVPEVMGNLVQDTSYVLKQGLQLRQPLLAIPALMHSYVECALPSPFQRHVLKEPFT